MPITLRAQVRQRDRAGRMRLVPLRPQLRQRIKGVVDSDLSAARPNANADGFSDNSARDAARSARARRSPDLSLRYARPSEFYRGTLREEKIGDKNIGIENNPQVNDP